MHSLTRYALMALVMLLSTAFSRRVPARPRRVPAPGLRAQGLVNAAPEARPLGRSALQGRVTVLLFFVAGEDYSTAALREAKRLMGAYPARRMRLLGVHSPPAGWRSREERRAGRAAGVRRSLVVGPRSPFERQAGWQRRQVSPLQALCAREHLPFPFLIDADHYLARRYHIRAYPTFVLIAPDGTLGPRVVGAGAYPRLAGLISRLLKEIRPAPATPVRPPGMMRSVP